MLKGEVVQVAVDAHQLTILEDRLPKQKEISLQKESSFQKKKNAKVKEKYWLRKLLKSTKGEGATRSWKTSKNNKIKGKILSLNVLVKVAHY